MKKSAKPKPKRRKMAPISEEMKEWANLLSQELEKWPKVSAKPMFGMRCYYRGSKVFGALPVTRSIDNGNSFMFKIHPLPPALLKKADGDSRVSASADHASHRRGGSGGSAPRLAQWPRRGRPKVGKQG